MTVPSITEAAADLGRIWQQHAAATAKTATDFDQLATSITAKEPRRMKLHPEALTRVGRRNPLHAPKTAKQLRREYAAAEAQARGLKPDAKSYFRAVQTVKADYARRILTGQPT